MENIISNIIIILAFSCTLLIVSQIFKHKIAIWPYFSHLLLISIVQDEDIFIHFYLPHCTIHKWISCSKLCYYRMLYTIKYILFRSYTYFLEAWNLFLPLNCLLILYLQKQTRKDNTFVCVQLRMCAYVHGFSYTHILNNTSTYCIF